LPANKLISERSFQKLLNLAKQGATILIYKNLPQDVPGLGQIDNRRKIFQQLIDQLKFQDDGSVKKASIAKGTFFMSDNMDALLEMAKARKESYAEKGLSVLRRKNTDGTVYFINNRTGKAFNDWIELNGNPVSLALFDAMTGKNGLAKSRKNGNGAMEVLVQLQSYESVIIQSYNTKKAGAVYPYVDVNGEPQEIKGLWTLKFLDGGPVIPDEFVIGQLGSWTEMREKGVSDFSGTAKYTMEFERPVGNPTSWILDLGKVNETAEVIVNGKKIATLIGPTFQCIIPSSAFQQNNKLEIIVANLMANRISYMDRNNIPWKIFYNTNMPARRRENVNNGLFDASGWKPLPSGLSGPVTITPVK
jgi:hypothetical protein